MSKWQIFFTGTIGAFAPQILRWYSQGAEIPRDPMILAGQLVITILFIGLAGYVALIWKVRDLKEAFFVGLGVPAIILSSGSDLGSIIKPPQAVAEEVTAVGQLLVRARSEDGAAVTHGTISVSDPRGLKGTYYSGSPNKSLTLAAGTYDVVVQAEGFETEARKQVVIEPNKRAIIEVTLRKLSPGERFIQGLTKPFEPRAR